MLEIGVPSGFEPDIMSTGSVRDLKKIEPKDRQVVMYFDQVGITMVLLFSFSFDFSVFNIMISLCLYAYLDIQGMTLHVY